MNRKRKSQGGNGNRKNSKTAKVYDNPIDVDFDPDNVPFVDDINDLFKMGFVSIEEVDYFDPKKHAENDNESENNNDNDNESDNLNFIPERENSAMKYGWTVSTIAKEETKPLDEKQKLQQKKKKSKKQKTKTASVPVVEAPEISETDLTEWRRFNLELPLLQGLKQAGFHKPMPIQRAALEAILLNAKRDILGSAPTGSGKTLAFGLPLLNQILKGGEKDGGLCGLIIVPTRELAVQIEKHLKLVSRFTRKIRIATIVGGLSQEKQNRQLKGNPDLIIATPGRLNELMEFDQDVRGMITRVKFLILDEADRMVQVGHYKELDDILSRILKYPNDSRQILLFSATLVESRDTDSPFARLCKKLDLNRNSKDLEKLNFAGKPSELQESFASCSSQEDKEAVLFGFLRELKKENGRFGRILLFANSIDTIRKISHLLALLKIPTISLHAQMQQRQRLNNLDKFRASEECVMIASDVAARGIDITGIDHVIHFHLPKGKETYVHRCGRTARANLSGTSLALVSPEERKLSEVCSLRRPEVIQYTPDARDMRDFIIPILKLARRIEKTEHSMRSAKSEINWAQKLADECELVLDEDNDPSYKKRQEQAKINPKAQAKELEIAKAKLDEMLKF